MLSIKARPDEVRKLTNPAPNELYHHQALQQKGWFRLLVIEPSPDPDEKISCSLLHRPLTHEMLYEALSYTWGEENAEYPIFIDGGVFRVRRNLYCALRELRSAHEPRILWVDALCINQSDKAEQGLQVAQMGRIYSTAQMVIIWLGESNQHTELGMLSLVEILKKCNAAFGTNSASLDVSLQSMADGFASFLALPDSENRMLGIVALYIRPWWRRVWTTQEIGLAQRAEVHCGDKHLPWDYFVLFSDMFTIRPVLDVLQRHSPRSEAGRKALGGLPAVIAKARSVRDMWARRKTDKISLSFLVHTTFDRLATDPRDKIYALLGLVNEGATLEPDYTLNTSKVYTAGFKAILQDNKDLRTFSLLLEGNLSRNQTLPSWVPDLQAISQARDLVPLSGLDGGKAGRIYSASPPADKDSEFPVGFEENDAVLLLEGVAVDILDYVGDPAPSVQVGAFRGIQSSVKQTISQWKSSIVKKPGIYITGETSSSAFWKTMVIDQKVVGYHAAFSKLEKERHQIRLDKPDKAIPPATPEQEERLIQVLDVSEGSVSHLSNRRFVTARRGYMGLAPPTAKNGDVVCVLQGGEVPYILRPLANGRYMMLGECYVHGIMDGEVVEGVEKGMFAYRKFSLV